MSNHRATPPSFVSRYRWTLLYVLAAVLVLALLWVTTRPAGAAETAPTAIPGPTISPVPSGVTANPPTLPVLPTAGTAVCLPAGATATCFSDGAGSYSFRHGLHRVPTAVQVTLREPYVGMPGYLTRGSAMSVSVIVHRPGSGTRYVGPVVFSWSVV